MGRMTVAARAVEDFFRQRYGREALYLPSGRAALYFALREWLRPGDRILMSPVNDDVVFFVVLAAGLVPVLGPLDPQTGNLDPTAIANSTWPTLRAVMTTNLYGIPDRMDVLQERCRRHDLVLLEDAAHALDSHWGGRRIGQFGAAAAFSLHKHLGVGGGVLTFAESGRRDALERQVAQETRHRPLQLAIAHRVRALLSPLARTWPGHRLGRLRDRLVSRPPERLGHRMPYELSEVRRRQQEGGGWGRFEQWVRVDNYMYRTWPLRHMQRVTLRRLAAFEDDRRCRIAGAARLLQSGLASPTVRLPTDTALFRVPLFVGDRERVRRYCGSRGFPIDYIYDPPLDVYAPELAQPLAASPAAAQWSRDVLPVDPALADPFLALLAEARQAREPLIHPIDWAAQSPPTPGTLEPIETAH